MQCSCLVLRVEGDGRWQMGWQGGEESLVAGNGEDTGLGRHKSRSFAHRIRMQQKSSTSKFRCCSVSAQVRPQCAPFITSLFHLHFFAANTVFGPRAFSTRYNILRNSLALHLIRDEHMRMFHNTMFVQFVSVLVLDWCYLCQICILRTIGQSHLTADTQISNL